MLCLSTRPQHNWSAYAGPYKIWDLESVINHDPSSLSAGYIFIFSFGLQNHRASSQPITYMTLSWRSEFHVQLSTNFESTVASDFRVDHDFLAFHTMIQCTLASAWAWVTTFSLTFTWFSVACLLNMLQTILIFLINNFHELQAC
jgi:hypothetical protein